MKTEPVTATTYVKRGDWLLLREALFDDDPESWPSLWLEENGEEITGRQKCPHCGGNLGGEESDWRKKFTFKDPEKEE